VRDDRDLARRVERVHVHDDAAGAENAEDRDQVLRAVRQHDADAIAFDDAEASQRRSEAIRAMFDLGERQLRAEE